MVLAKKAWGLQKLLGKVILTLLQNNTLKSSRCFGNHTCYYSTQNKGGGGEAVNPAYFVLILCNPYLSSEGLRLLQARISQTV